MSKIAENKSSGGRSRFSYRRIKNRQSKQITKYFTCSNDSIEANSNLGTTGCGFGATGVMVGGGGLTVSFVVGSEDDGGIIKGGCSENVDDSVDGCVKRCSKRFEHSCRRDFFDSFESS